MRWTGRVENALFNAFGGSLLFVALHAQGNFSAKWWVWPAASALGDRSTFMSERNNRRTEQMSQPQRKKIELCNL